MRQARGRLVICCPAVNLRLATILGTVGIIPLLKDAGAGTVLIFGLPSHNPTAACKFGDTCIFLIGYRCRIDEGLGTGLKHSESHDFISLQIGTITLRNHLAGRWSETYSMNKEGKCAGCRGAHEGWLFVQEGLS
jgi:hypothetical protein